jgi:preprotein translocase subunit SecA
MEGLYDTQVKRDEFSEGSLTREELIEEFQEDAQDAYAAKVEEYGAELLRDVERYLVLQVVDVRWREHLESMEYLRDGIHLRAMAQKDPLAEYRAEGHAMFEELTATIQEEVVRYLLRIQIEQRPEQEPLAPAASEGNGAGSSDLVYEHESVAGADAIRAAGAGAAAPATGARGASMAGGGGAAATTVSTGQRVATEFDRVGRNDPCPCGSGKKFKKCHGA